MKNEISVNDGKGLFDNVGMCDSLTNDLNALVKNIASGQYIQFCVKVTEMTAKLQNLKKGITDDLASKDQIIEELKRINDELSKEIKKDGVTNGAD